MYRKEVNERSPMRVFEKSMHGGLGRGNVGVVAARAGLGKTPLLVQIALDDLLRDRKVLHVSHEHGVDHVRAFYDEILHDLSEVSRLDDPEAVKLDVERHRLIYSLMADSEDGPRSERGGRSPVSKILEVVGFAREVAHFHPDVIIVDGFDFVHGTDAALRALGEMAEQHDVELWLSAQVESGHQDPGQLPEPLDRLGALIHVVVFLESAGDVARLRLLKDHDSPKLADFNLRLDPHTLRIIDEDVPPPSERPLDRKRFRLISGASRGAEAAFGECAERWGIREINYTYGGHRFRERQRGVVELSQAELNKGDFSLTYVSRRLNRTLTKIPYIRSVLQTTWHQITNARQVFVVGAIQDDDTVRGGTGWGAELARLWNKPLFVFDQNKGAWFRWSGSAWEISKQPSVSRESFAGLGTLKLNDAGRAAISDLFQRSFGAPEPD